MNLTAKTLDIADQGRNYSLPARYAEEDKLSMKLKAGRLPNPIFTANGKRLLAIQEPADRMYGSIIIPADASEKHRATIGIVCKLGNGYDPDDPIWNEWERGGLGDHAPEWKTIFNIGQRIVWGRYQGDVQVKMKVTDEWWDSEEEKQAGEGRVQIVVIHVKDILGVV